MKHWIENILQMVNVSIIEKIPTDRIHVSNTEEIAFILMIIHYLYNKLPEVTKIVYIGFQNLKAEWQKTN